MSITKCGDTRMDWLRDVKNAQIKLPMKHAGGGRRQGIDGRMLKWCGERENWVVNERQKRCVWVGIAVILLTAVFPPTRRGYEPGGSIPPGIRPPPGVSPTPIYVKPPHYGYTFLLSAEVGEIGFGKLILQWAVVALITGAFIYKYKDKKRKESGGEEKE